jgi:GTP-binding protein HflX
VLVGVALKPTRGATRGGTTETDLDASLEELRVLAESAGAQVEDQIQQIRDAPEAATLIGAGKLREVAGQAEASGADVVIFDRDLTPTQLRNLERALPCKVVDRTQLILDIFARRARTREGQLQVELAQLNYLLPRLTGRGAAMSRLGGGIGTRGPGETQLETDRRRIHRRIRKIGEQLESVRSHRAVQRQQRQAVPLATVALVGYTNAGKSTLFNRLTGAAVLADSKMFATLDPTVRQLTLPSRRRALLSDTVGFISNLPATLVKSFRATLEEVTEAGLILHLVDVSSRTAAQQTEQVLRVIREIGAGETPRILVLTKADLVDQAEFDAQATARRLLFEAGAEGMPAPPAAALSSVTGEGIDSLLSLVDRMLPADPLQHVRLRLPASDGAKLHALHQYGRVIAERWENDTCLVEADVPESLLRQVAEFVF